MINYKETKHYHKIQYMFTDECRYLQNLHFSDETCSINYRKTEVSNTLQSRCHNILTDDLCPLLIVDDKFCQIIKQI